MTEKKLLGRLRKMDAAALTQACCEHGENMLILAFTIIQDPEDAFILVYDLFITLRETRFAGAQLPLHTFLYDQVRKACASSPR